MCLRDRAPYFAAEALPMRRILAPTGTSFRRRPTGFGVVLIAAGLIRVEPQLGQESIGGERGLNGSRAHGRSIYDAVRIVHPMLGKGWNEPQPKARQKNGDFEVHNLDPITAELPKILLRG